MFRRWLLSMPDEMVNDDKAPLSLAGLDDTNSVVLVGEGSLGQNAQSHPEQVTRAYLIPIEKTGKQAWWITPENHKAKVNLAKNPRTLATDAWEAAQGDTAEVGVGGLKGFGSIDSDPKVSDKLITPNTLGPAKVAPELVREHFFDLTAHSQGMLTNVRTGQLKKDLSLLFEKSNSSLPAPYKFNVGSDSHEPSIRPMTAELPTPKIAERQFQSWTNMRHYYRMYRQNSDATVAGTNKPGCLTWNQSKPETEALIPILYRDKPKAGMWQGNNAYLRVPILAKLTFIYSLMSELASGTGTASDPKKYRLYLVYTPVFTYWNPYNIEMRIPDNTLGQLSSTYQVLPMGTQFYLGTVAQGAAPGSLLTGNAHSFLRSGNGGDIIFKPGEMKVFSHKAISAQTGGQAAPLDLLPGFDPLAYGGDKLQPAGGTYTEAQDPGLAVQFSYSIWGGNVSYGNTPGSLCHTSFWLPDGEARNTAFEWNIPLCYQNDWFNLAQTYTPLNAAGSIGIGRWSFSDSYPVPIAYAQLVIKGLSEFDYESITWAKDWRCRNWVDSPPFYFGHSMYISENDTIAHTQRLDNPYVMNFGPMDMSEMPKVVFHIGDKPYLGSGTKPFEKVNAVPSIELPSAPVASLAGFAGMRINPGWADPLKMKVPNLSLDGTGGNDTHIGSLYFALNKTLSYQSGVTGPGIGNSFMHPMLARTGIYQNFNNSVSSDPADRTKPLENINFNDNKVFCDYWDHVFLLNDALWDDYFVSSLADQTRPGASAAASLSANIDHLVAGEPLSNSRYHYYSGGQTTTETKAELQATDGYLKAAKHLVVDGMFNVNSTSVAAWQALFAGIRERQLVFRDSSGALKKITVPSGKRIAISRFDTEVSDQEMAGPEYGATLPDGTKVWSGVRYLDDDQLLKLAEQCVKQVKLRGPFLNFSEFINRRLSNDDLGLMGALQSAIDYDDKSPDPRSLNYRFKNGPDFMLKKSQLGTSSFSTPEAAEGSRFAGIPGYVIQSDLLKPIANTLSVRDDTFRIRAYGEALDPKGKVIARAWCEAVVQRAPEYCDPTNEIDASQRELDANGKFSDTTQLTPINLRFGRRFHLVSFRWLSGTEV